MVLPMSKSESVRRLNETEEAWSELAAPKMKKRQRSCRTFRDSALLPDSYFSK
jgi:hypothetical protein